MISSSKIKSVDFYRKIPRDLTEASLSGAGLSIVAALSMMFLFGMELNEYMTVNTSTSVVVDKSSDGEFLRLELNISFPALSCEFASVDVNDVLGTNRVNITKTIRKFSIDRNLRPTGPEFHPGGIPKLLKHGDEGDEEYGEGSVSLTSANFERFTHQYPILVVNFFAPWCYWSNRLKPSWEKTSQIIRERYDPDLDGRILLAKVDCTVEVELCKRYISKLLQVSLISVDIYYDCNPLFVYECRIPFPRAAISISQSTCVLSVSTSDFSDRYNQSFCVMRLFKSVLFLSKLSSFKDACLVAEDVSLAIEDDAVLLLI